MKISALLICLTVCLTFGAGFRRRPRLLHPYNPRHSPYGRSSRNFEDFDYLEDLSGLERIGGGRPVFPGEFPYIVEIRYNGLYTCAGAVVIGEYGNLVIVTTGTCVTNDKYNKDPNALKETIRLTAVAGNVDRSKNSSSAQYREIRRINRHPKWKRHGQFDIAVIQLYEGFHLNNYIKDIDLPPKSDFYPDSLLTAAGWGHPKESYYSDELQLVTVAPYPIASCKNELGGDMVFDKESLCTKDVENNGQRQVCKGDWGSPAVGIDKETGVLYLAGLFSWTPEGCGENNKPSVFVKVSAFKSWILENSSPFLPGGLSPESRNAHW